MAHVYHLNCLGWGWDNPTVFILPSLIALSPHPAFLPCSQCGFLLAATFGAG